MARTAKRVILGSLDGTHKVLALIIAAGTEMSEFHIVVEGYPSDYGNPGPLGSSNQVYFFTSDKCVLVRELGEIPISNEVARAADAFAQASMVLKQFNLSCFPVREKAKLPEFAPPAATTDAASVENGCEEEGLEGFPEGILYGDGMVEVSKTG